MAEVAKITRDEIAELGQCETVIERGLATFVDVGTALASIRDGRLYRATYETFEDYCRERWGFSKRHANRLVEAAEVVTELGPIGPITNEGQARAIASTRKEHGPEFAAEVLREAAEVGLSARSIHETAARAMQTRVRAERQRQELARLADNLLADPATRTEVDDIIDQLDAGHTIVINLRDPVATALDRAGYVTRIDRNTPWGNPFVLNDDGTRDQVIASYRDHYLPNKPSLLNRIGELHGRALGCWCAPLPCHGDVLKEAVEADDDL